MFYLTDADVERMKLFLRLGQECCVGRENYIHDVDLDCGEEQDNMDQDNIDHLRPGQLSLIF